MICCFFLPFSNTDPRAQVDDDELDDPNYDEFYDKLNVRVPPSTYDTSDFDKSHLFHIRMSNYLR